MKMMNLRLRLSETLVLPLAHMDILQGVVYKMLSFDPTLSEQIHDKQMYDSRAYKYFCFSDINGRYHIKNKRLFFNDGVEWEIRAADDRIIDTIYHYIICNERIEIDGTDCTVSSVNISQQKFLHTECVFTAVTPIIASEILNTGYTMYYNPFQPEFSQKITGNIINKYRSFYGIPPEGGILFQPVRPDDKNKCVTKYKNLIINAWYGDYLVKAERAVLDFIYHTGLGRRNAAGFGTISEIIS